MKRDPSAAVWQILASERTTAVLTLAMSVSAFVAIAVPQGAEALDLLKASRSDRLLALAEWGLTNVFNSKWVLALGVLLVANLVALFYSASGRKKQTLDAEPPKNAPLSHTVAAKLPEQAVEIVRSLLFYRLGTPALEKADRSRVLMVFDPPLGTMLAPVITHAGLILLVLGAGLYASEAHTRPKLVRAMLEVTDSQTKTTGLFDMAQNEPFQFFQWRAQYFLRAYEPARPSGLGPAVLIERRLPNQPRGEGFWVYQKAPEGFDAAHRSGEVSIKALSMGYSPLPGAGLADSPFGALMLFGLGLIAFGLVQAQRANGRLWIEVDGEEVRFYGVPRKADDADFSRRFDKWSKMAKAALEAD